MPWQLKLEPAKEMPIWRQIQDGVRRAIASGELLSGDALPSVREAAVNWRVNPATVSRAYRGLVDEGLLIVRRGDGTFVSEEIGGRAERLREEELRSSANTFVDTAKALGADEEESCRTIRVVWHERGENS